MEIDFSSFLFFLTTCKRPPLADQFWHCIKANKANQVFFLMYLILLDSISCIS